MYRRRQEAAPGVGLEAFTRECVGKHDMNEVLYFLDRYLRDELFICLLFFTFFDLALRGTGPARRGTPPRATFRVAEVAILCRLRPAASCMVGHSMPKTEAVDGPTTPSAPLRPNECR